ncbi:hypothetical protein JCM14469_39560 [Desulfatiferula olefinivorans]
MKVREIVDSNKQRKLPLVLASDTIREVMEKMLAHPHTRLMYVIDDQGRCSGVISLGALIRHLFPGSFEPSLHSRHLIPMITAETAEHIMNRGLIYASLDDEVGIVIKEMVRAAIKEIPILDNEKRFIADITMLDLLKHYKIDNR